MAVSQWRALSVAMFLTVLAAPAVAEDFWPKVLAGEEGEVVIYQPQIESLEGRTLQSRAAVAVKSRGAEAPVFGAMWFESLLSTDEDTRMASLESVKVTASRFPGVDEAQLARLSAYLERDIPTWDLTFSIDRIIADLAAESASGGGDERFGHEPPRIHVRQTPTVLVLVDGDPIFARLEGPDLEYVVNSAFFLVRELGGRSLYLRGGGLWFTADDLAGRWAVTADLPEAVAGITPELEADEKEQAEAAAADAAELDVQRVDSDNPPEIIVSTVPAEIVVTDGAPDFASVAGTQLLSLRNCETDVVLDIASQQYFVLVAGRWFRAPSLENGPWTFVAPEEVPEDFARIPADSDLATVLPSVPGTQEAREAVLDTQIPQTAEIDRQTASVTVAYDGDPEFESCAAGVAYARNTDKSVLLIDGTYYCCDNAVWFIAPRPDGPWAVATELPAAIQDLPPECPVYNVKYVTIYESTPEVVYVGYTPGYYSCYAYHGCVIYGTGYWYRPWYHTSYYPRPVTYGFGVHYNPWTGWGFSFGVSYGWISVGVGWGRYPYRGWGPAGYRYGYRSGYWRGYSHGYRHGYRRGAAAGYRAGYRAANRPAHANLYRNRTDGVRRTGDLNRPDRREPRPVDRRNDVYTDRDGNVYRDRDGTWEKREGGQWKPDREGSGAPANRDREAPQRDQQPSDRQRDQQPQDRGRDQLQRDQPRPDRQPSGRQPPDRSVDRDRGGQGSSRQQLDRDRSSRDRGSQRQRQAPPPRQRGGGRGRGGRG